jgi:hypothetical protein
LEKTGTLGYGVRMTDAMDRLEQRIDEVRAEVRRAIRSGDLVTARSLRGELRRLELDWDEAALELAPAAVEAQPRMSSASAGSLLPVREQVHQALTLLSVPAAPKLIVAVHEAFFAGTLAGPQLTSLRRDEERSFRSAPHARPYYLCGALTADRLAPARGLLAVSTWPLPSRIIGPLSSRVDFLNAAVRVAAHVGRAGDPSPAAARLLWRFAANIPNAADTTGVADPRRVSAAATAELKVHDEVDRSQRETAAQRARRQLDEAQQLFGAPPLGVARRGATGE